MVAILSSAPPALDISTTRQEERYTITPLPRVSPAKAILTVIDIMQTLKNEERSATPDEQVLLGQWNGWGSVVDAFNPYEIPKGIWGEVRQGILTTIGPKGYKQASEATFNSFFTDTYLVDAMWKILIQLGFTGGKVAEFGCGTGHFLAHAPTDLDLQMVGVERDLFSASIAKERLPNATIINGKLEDIIIRENSFDAIIGNVPFANIRIFDRGVNRRELTLHNFFIWKYGYALRPGGIGAIITSHFTLDAEGDEQRKILHEANVRLLGVIRLPMGAHKSAHTQVVTDILIIQKYGPNMGIPWQGHDWLQAHKDIIPDIPINEYFREHMSSIVGTPSIDHGMHGEETLLIKAPDNYEEALDKTISSVVREIQVLGGRYHPPVDLTVIPEHMIRLRVDGLKEGSFYIVHNRLVQVVGGELKPFKEEQIEEAPEEEDEGEGEETPTKKKKKKQKPKVSTVLLELTALTRIKEAVSNLLNAERDFEKPDRELEPLRATLNTLYDSYVKTYGFISRAKITIREGIDKESKELIEIITRRLSPAMYAFRKDLDHALVLGLEAYDDETEKANKADIFHHRVNTPASKKNHAESPAEAVALCLDRVGMLDLQLIADLTNQPVENVPAYLGDLVYHDPETQTWQIIAEYLSGNVRRKLQLALKAEEREPGRYERNIKDLTEIIPENLLPEQIKAILGAPWISSEDIEAFCFEHFQQKTKVIHEPITGSWDVDEPTGCKNSEVSTLQWGTSRVNAYKLIAMGLNKKIPVVHDHFSDGSSAKNVGESLAAQEKLRAIQVRFGEWIWEDNERATRLAEVYNETFNAIVSRTYDGSHLTFPGMSPQWQGKLYPWQLSFIWRMLSSKSALNAHPVGAGKTKTMIAAAMLLRQTGLTKKAAIVVPNHLLEQITAEAQQLYPGANILMISRDDLSKERRTIFAARIATGDYDFVVMTHSGFASIGVHPDTECAYIDERIELFEESLISLERDKSVGENKRSIKNLEKSLETMRQRQQQLLSRPHDGGVTFEQLGITYVMVDEAHFFKNLGLPTNIQALTVSKASKRATDMEMKLRWLEKHNEGKPFASFFTATPMSNSMVEAYVMCWYLNQDLLKEYGLTTVDSFASMFIEFTTNVEVSPNGATFRLHTRPSNFVNLPELQTLIAEFADIRGTDILSSKRPERREYTFAIKPSDAITAYVNSLVARSEAIRQRLVDITVDNMLTVTTDGRLAALDLSLVDIHSERALKLEEITDNMVAIYNRWQEEAAYLDGEYKSLQIGFCDLGTPNDKKGNQVYGITKKLLIQKGIPARGIRFIHEAKSHTAKKILFEQCRTGQVAIILGSTEKMGTGTNIQTRAAALHHFDAPWRPDQIEQRDGRIQRPGNLYPVVEIFRYVTERTFDAYSWQILALKAIFFDQLRSGRIKAREINQIGDTALSFGQVKAAATGDPLMLAQANADIAYNQLDQLYMAHGRARGRDSQEVERARNNIKHYTSQIDRTQKVINKTKQAQYPGFISRDDDRFTDRQDIANYIAGRVNAKITSNGGYETLGTWFDVTIHLEVVMKGILPFPTLLVGDSDDIKIDAKSSWAGEKYCIRFVDAIEDAFQSLEDNIGYYQRKIDECKGKIEDYDARSHIPFAREEERIEARKRKYMLDSYVNLVARSNGKEEDKAEIEALRDELMRGIQVVAETSSIPQEKTPPPRRPSEKPVVIVEAAIATVVEPPVIEEVKKAEPIEIVVQLHPQKITKTVPEDDVSHRVDIWAMRAQMMKEKNEKKKNKTGKQKKNQSSSTQQSLFSWGDDGEKHPEVKKAVAATVDESLMQTSLF